MNVWKLLCTTQNCANKTPFALTLRVLTNVLAYMVLNVSMRHAKVSIEMLKLLGNIETIQICLIIVGEAETPPPVQQITPPGAEENRLQVLITGLVVSTVRECD